MERAYRLNEDQALQLFSSDNFITLNKKLLETQGPEAAVFIANLVDKFLFFKSTNQLKEGRWFFLLHSSQMQSTGMNEDRIRKYKKYFIEKGIISSKMMGNPAKEWYKIHVSSLLSLINNSPVSFQRSEKSEGSYNIYYTNIYSNNNNKKNTTNAREEISKKQKNIIPPKLEWVHAYRDERKSIIDPETFHDWYTSKGWKIGKEPMKDWQAAFRTWEKEENKKSSSYTKVPGRTLKPGQKPTMKYKEPTILKNKY